MFRPTVLAVDDTDSGLRAIAGVLACDDYTLITASSGREALAVAQASPPDVVLLDVMMPEMDGFETCRRLRADRRLADVPIVLVTALDDRAARLEGIEAGADDFLTKPLDRLELRARVRGLVRLNRFRRALEDRARFEWIAEHGGVGCLLVDAAGVVTWLNAAARDLLDIADVDVADRPVFATLLDRRHRQADGGPVRLTPQTATMQLVRPASPGQRATWLTLRRLHEPSTGHCWVQITDATAAHDVRRDTGTFHSIVQHKLKTPLNGVLGCAALLAEADADTGPEEIAELARMVHDSAERLHADVRSIFGYLEAVGRPAAGAVSAAEIERVARSAARDAGIADLTVRVAASAAGAVLAWSPQALDIALRELLQNAVKFHPVQRPAVALAVAADGDAALRLTLTDDGVWLSSEQRRLAWQPYRQGDAGTGELPGAGLGLPLVATLVAEAGGTCQLANRADRPGVEVTLRVPATLAAGAALEAPQHVA